MALELPNCCCCIQLRTGSLIIGYIGLVGNIYLALISILALVAITVVAGNVLLAYILLCINLVLVGINLIFTSLLVFGIHKDKREFVKAYLIFDVVFIILYAIIFFIGLSSLPGALVIVSDIITILLSIYFLLVIRSYYLKMDDPSRMPAMYNTT